MKLRSLIRSSVRRLTSSPEVNQITDIPIKSILRSGEGGISSGQYARLIGKPLRSSERAIDGPHLEFLKVYSTRDISSISDDEFKETSYYKNAAECISFTGNYFFARNRFQIKDVASDFLIAFKGGRPARHTELNGHNQPSDHIEVRKVAHSDCYELIHGNHRLASHSFKGESTVRAKVIPGESLTPAQQMLLDVLWQGNRIELYQPIHLPEVATWPLVRKCADRGELVSRFLSTKASMGTSVDVGCSYGWFVRHMEGLGFKSFGVDRDPFSLKIANEIYGVNQKQLFRSDIVDWLTNESKTYNVVSCYSVAHHFALGRSAISCEELFKLLDGITKDVLFFDTGESHENWFKDSLSGWDVNYIVDFVKSQTTFRDVIPLGKDSDDVGVFSGNYGRTLFACVR